MNRAPGATLATTALLALALLATTGCAGRCGPRATRGCDPCRPDGVPVVAQGHRVERTSPGTSAPTPPVLAAPEGKAPPTPENIGGFPHSDFLGYHYAQLKPWKNPGTWYWMKEGIDLRGYDNVLIDPIAWKPLAGSVAATLPEGKQASLQKCLQNRMLDRLDPYYPLLDDPAPHTLRVRFAITEADLEPTEDGKPAGATIEGDIRDAETGEVYVAYVSTIRNSTRGDAQAAPEIEDCWGPVDGAFREWADQLLTWLDHHTQ